MAAVGNQTRLDMVEAYVAATTPFILYLFNELIFTIQQNAPSGATSVEAMEDTDFTSGYRVGTGTFTVNYWTITFNTSLAGSSAVLSNNIVNTILNGNPTAATVKSYGVFNNIIGTDANTNMVTCGDFTTAQDIGGIGAPYTLPAGAIQWTLS